MAILYPPFLQQSGFSVAILGTLIALDGVGRLLSRLPAGLAYTLPRARLLTAGAMVLVFASTALIPFAGATWELAGLILVRASGYGIASTIMMAIVMDLKPGSMSAGSVMGWFTSAFSLGHALGAMLAGFLADRAGYAATFLTLGSLPMLALFFLIPLALASPAASRPTSGIPRHPARAMGLSQVGLSRLRRGWEETQGLGAMVFLAALVAFYLNLMTDTLGTLFPLFALGLGLSLTTVGSIRGISSVMGITARLLSGVIFSLLDYRKINLLTIVLLALSVILLPSFRSVVALGGLLSLFGVSRGLLRVSSGAMVMTEIQGGKRGTGLASGIYHAGLDLGVLAGPILGGLAAQAFGIPTTFRLLPLIFLAFIGLALLQAGRRHLVGELRAEPRQ